MFPSTMQCYIAWPDLPASRKSLKIGMVPILLLAVGAGTASVLAVGWWCWHRRCPRLADSGCETLHRERGAGCPAHYGVAFPDFPHQETIRNPERKSGTVISEAHYYSDFAVFEWGDPRSVHVVLMHAWWGRAGLG